MSEVCMQASTALTFNYTSFTLSNFTQSFFLNITNVNGTNVVPAGMTASGHTLQYRSLLIQICLEHQHVSQPGSQLPRVWSFAPRWEDGEYIRSRYDIMVLGRMQGPPTR